MNNLSPAPLLFLPSQWQGGWLTAVLRVGFWGAGGWGRAGHGSETCPAPWRAGLPETRCQKPLALVMLGCRCIGCHWAWIARGPRWQPQLGAMGQCAQTAGEILWNPTHALMKPTTLQAPAMLSSYCSYPRSLMVQGLHIVFNACIYFYVYSYFCMLHFLDKLWRSVQRRTWWSRPSLLVERAHAPALH